MRNNSISNLLTKRWWCVFLAVILVAVLMDIATIALTANTSFEDILPSNHCTILDWGGSIGNCLVVLPLPLNLIVCVLSFVITLKTMIAASKNKSKKLKTAIIICGILTLIFLSIFTVITISFRPTSVTYNTPISIFFSI